MKCPSKKGIFLSVAVIAHDENDMSNEDIISFCSGRSLLKRRRATSRVRTERRRTNVAWVLQQTERSDVEVRPVSKKHVGMQLHAFAATQTIAADTLR